MKKGHCIALLLVFWFTLPCLQNINGMNSDDQFDTLTLLYEKTKGVKMLFSKNLQATGPKWIPEESLSAAVEDIKSILKSLVPTEKELDEIKTTIFFIKKGEAMPLRRLFCYKKLEQVINDKRLSHIHLPRKVLVITDLELNKMLSPTEAASIIDGLQFKFQYYGDKGEISVQDSLGEEKPRYKIRVYAEKKENFVQKPFNKDAQEELRLLCKHAPFDVGFDNIFRDEAGDAVIIDTEFKNNTTEECHEKLYRYF